jgi:squalene-associated FAD-dependent desaturase
MSTAGRQPGAASVAVVGGGLAGLAAAVAAAAEGLQVELFEARKQLSGRAGSLRDPRTGEVLDCCQHVALGCCTNLADFCRRSGLADAFRCQRELHFIGPEGDEYCFRAAAGLPAPLHLAPALLRLGYLTPGQRWAVLRGVARLAREQTTGENSEQGQTIGQWLRRHGQSEPMIERFWSVVLVSALGETVERAALAAAQKVFVDGFLAARQAYQLEVPQLPLGQTLHCRVGDWLRQHHVAVHLSTPLRQIEGGPERAAAVVLPDGTRRQFDFIIAAVPWQRVRSLLPETMRAVLPALEGIAGMQSSPITAVHLWFDRPITSLPHAVLVGRTSQWVFNHGRQHQGACRYQVVISASRGLADLTREEVLGEVRRDLESIWPDARRAELRHWRVITHRSAVFSVRPGLDRLRPTQQTPIANLMLAGDWTATGWPATMESAVRSGYLAVEAILKALGEKRRLLVPDLPRSWLARALLGRPTER